jgi:hypothetical protein
MTDDFIKILTDFKEKRFSFFADMQKTNKECYHTFAHLAACTRTKPTHKGSQKSKSATLHFFNIIFNEQYLQIRSCKK